MVVFDSIIVLKVYVMLFVVSAMFKNCPIYLIELLDLIRRYWLSRHCRPITFVKQVTFDTTRQEPLDYFGDGVFVSVPNGERAGERTSSFAYLVKNIFVENSISYRLERKDLKTTYLCKKTQGRPSGLDVFIRPSTIVHDRQTSYLDARPPISSHQQSVVRPRKKVLAYNNSCVPKISSPTVS